MLVSRLLDRRDFSYVREKLGLRASLRLRAARGVLLFRVVLSEYRRFAALRRVAISELGASLEDAVSTDLRVRAGLAAVAGLGLLELAGIPTAERAVRLASASIRMLPGNVIEFPAPSARR